MEYLFLMGYKATRTTQDRLNMLGANNRKKDSIL